MKQKRVYNFQKIFSLILLFLLSINIFGQVDVEIETLPAKDNPLGYDRDSLVSWIENILLGGGGYLDTSTIVITGNREAFGRFHNGFDIGFNEGLILSTGRVESAEAPNQTGAYSDEFYPFDPFVSHGDPDLLNMYNTIFAGLNERDTAIYYTGDAAVLEFVFKPYGNQILLDYVFASEEYPSPKFQGPEDIDLTGFPTATSQIFDLFGISIEKFGFHNLAFMMEDSPDPTPEATRWIHVGNVNAGKNASYYQPNPEEPPFGRILGTQFDAVTKTEGDLGPLIIQRKEVDPCGAYRVKIAIEDFYWDSPDPEQLPSGFQINSAVFLGEKSLVSNIQQSGVIYQNYTIDHYFFNPGLEGDVVEDCNYIIATITLEDTMMIDYAIPYKIQLPDFDQFVEVSYEDGTVITDDSVRILAGELEKVIHIKGINLDGDYPSAAFTYPVNKCDVPGPWGGGFTGRIDFNLRDNTPITLSQNPKIYEAYCKETIELTLTDVAQNGVAPLLYFWNNDIVSKDTITYKVEGSPDIVNILVKDYCDNETNATVQINNKPIVLEEILDAFLCGPGQSVVVDVFATIPNYPDYTIDNVSWYKVSPYVYLGDAPGNQMTVFYDEDVGDGIWECGFEITDCCGGTQTGSFIVNQSELTLGDDIWICKGMTRTLSANAEAQWFEWFATSDPGTILSTTNSLTVTPDITTEYALRILDLCDVEQTAYITVNVDLFEPQITIDPVSAEICPGTPITLTANDALEYNWMPGNEITQSITLTPTIPDVYVYTLTASSEYCIDKVTTASFEVFPEPVADFSTDPAEDACTNEPVDFIYPEVVTNETFEWNFDDGSPVSNLSNPSHVYTNPGTYYVNLLVNKYICDKDTTIPVIINPLPSPAFSGDILNGCSPVTVNFTDLSADVQSGAVYQWDFGDGNTSNDPGNVSHTYENAGLFNVSLTINNTERCSYDTVINQYIQVNPNPIAGFDPDPAITTMDNPTIVFINTTLSDSAIYSYQWDFGDGSTSDIESPSHTYTLANTYDVILIVETINGCIDTVPGRVALTEEAVLFIPNAFTPNGDGLNDVFEIKGTPIADYNLYIYDRWGNQIWSTHTFQTFWDGTDKSGNPVASGTYVYQIVGTDYLQQQVSYQGTVTVIR